MQPLFKGNQGLLLRDSVKKPMTHSLSPLSVCLLFISSPTKLSSLLKCSFKCLTLHQLLSFCYLSPPSRFNTLHARICFFSLPHYSTMQQNFYSTKIGKYDNFLALLLLKTWLKSDISIWHLKTASFLTTFFHSVGEFQTAVTDILNACLSMLVCVNRMTKCGALFSCLLKNDHTIST